MKIGVLALQGAFCEHVQVLTNLGISAVEIRRPREMDDLDGLIIPGGESTTISRLIEEYGLAEPIHRLASDGKPILGTCAGAILLAKNVVQNSLNTLGLMDIIVRRNAFGRQVDSFETSLNIPCLGNNSFPAIFIRAPLIEGVGVSCEVLATLPSGEIVAVRQGNLIALSFHPELSPDPRLHAYFLKVAEQG